MIGDSKMHLAIAFGIKTTERGYKVRFITAADLVLQLEKAHRELRFDQYLKRATVGPRLLILDEIGYLPLKKEQADLFFQVVAKRYDRARSSSPPTSPSAIGRRSSTATPH